MSAATMYRVAATLAAVLIASCGKDNPAGPPVVSNVVVTPGADTLLTLGRTRQFTAVARDASGNPVSGVTIAWSSSNPSVATVDAASGIVTAVGNGLSIIRADAGGVLGQATLAVAQVVATVLVTPTNRSFTAVGDTQRFGAVAKDSGGTTVQGVRFLWGSSNPAVATVDTLGLATSRGSGQTTISATGRGVPGYGAVAVNQIAAYLVFVARPDTASAGEPFTRAAQVEIRDSSGALVTGARNAVTLGVETTYGSLSGALTVGAVGGVATFSNVSFGGLEGSYRLRATAAGFDTVRSTLVVMRPGVADTAIYVAGVQDGRVGDTMNVIFALYDRWRNPARDDTATVRLVVDSSEWGARIYGPTTVHGAFASAVFTGVSIDRPSIGVRFAAVVRRVRSAGGTIFFDSLPGPLTFFAAHGNNTCAVYGPRTYCWGYGSNGELGTGDSLLDSVPTLVRTAQVFTSVAVGHEHSCGLTAAGAAWCWGANGSGQAGVPPSGRQFVPVAVTGGLTFTQLAAGWAFSCGLTNANAVYCWGDNSLGQLGNGKAAGAGPVLVSGGHAFQQVSIGQDHACAIAVGGDAYCWGRNQVAQLGVGFTSASDSVPTLVLGGHAFRSIAAGDRHTCGLATDSTTFCWGLGSNGELGDSTLATDSVPGPIYGTHKFVTIASGNGTCGIDAAALLWCWGVRQEIDFFPDRYLVNLLYSGITAVVSGTGHQCFTSASFAGRLACLGQDAAGQLGDGRRSAPTTNARLVVRN